MSMKDYTSEIGPKYESQGQLKHLRRLDTRRCYELKIEHIEDAILRITYQIVCLPHHCQVLTGFARFTVTSASK